MELVASNLCIARGGRVVIDELSFKVPSGAALMLTGPNGAGKTTLLRAIAGLIQPERGRIELMGGSADQSIGECCHLIAHRDAVKSNMTVIENARFWGRYLGGGDRNVVPALERLGLDALASVPAGYLSAGQRRRVGLARLLLADRPLWLLDEPTVSLDTASIDAVQAIVRGHLAQGGLVVVATHVPLKIASEGSVTELRLGGAEARAKEQLA
jgi:heme exporter protein A